MWKLSTFSVSARCLKMKSGERTKAVLLLKIKRCFCRVMWVALGDCYLIKTRREMLCYHIAGSKICLFWLFEGTKQTLQVWFGFFFFSIWGKSQLRNKSTLLRVNVQRDSFWQLAILVTLTLLMVEKKYKWVIFYFYLLFFFSPKITFGKNMTYPTILWSWWYYDKTCF